MFFTPYFYTKQISYTGVTIYQIHLFLNRGGSSLFEAKVAEDAISFCKENGIVQEEVFEEDGCLFIRVNPYETNLDEFYSWNEAHGSDKECWRPFLLVEKGEDKDPWNLNGLLKGVSSLSGKNVFSIAEVILRHSTEY
jgi:hypothetical protein